MWLVCPIPSVIYLPYYLRFLTLLVIFIGGWIGYEVTGFVFGDSLFSMCWYGSSLFAGSMWCMPFLSTYSVSI